MFRNFPTAGMILADAFANQKELFEATGAAPKTVVFMHVNDTFGTAMKGGIGAVMPKFDMPYKIVAIRSPMTRRHGTCRSRSPKPRRLVPTHC